MVIIEVPENPNCEASELRVFHDVEAARAAAQVCLEQRPGEPAWYEVTGWTLSNTPVPAFGQRVDDSGEGLAVLVRGGDAGVRIRPAGSSDAWSLDNPNQLGVPFLLIVNDGRSVVYSEVVHG